MNSASRSPKANQRSSSHSDSCSFGARAAGLCLLLGGAVLPSTALGEPTSSGKAPLPSEPAAADSAAAAVRPPIVLEQQQPSYPVTALPRSLRGDVTVTVTIDALGSVTSVELAHAISPDLDHAAIEAASRWRFQPAMRGAVAVPSRIQLVFHFEPPGLPLLQPSSPPWPPSPPATAAAPAADASRVPAAPSGTPEIRAPVAANGGRRDPAAIDVTVVGRRPVSNRGASDFQIRVDQLADVPRANASELLKLAPGILLTSEGGEGHAEQVFLRGFDAREGQDIEFSVNGVPINEAGNLHGNGYADTHFIIPELVDQLRVLEGPFDPRQGNFAVAGSASYDLGLGDRGLTTKYTTGSWGTRRLLLLWGPEGESRHTFGGGEVFQSDGFGQNRDSRRATAMGQYEGSVGSERTSATYRLLGTAYATDYHSAGVVRVDDYQAGRIGFFDTYDFNQGGNASRFSLSADIESRREHAVLSQQVFVISRTMRLRENFTGFLLDVQDPLQTPHGQRGDLLDLEVSESTLGARGAAHFEGDLLRQRQAIEFGYFARGDAVTGTQQRIEVATQAPYRTETALDSKLADIGIYADVDLKLTRWLLLRGGLREDLFTFDVNNLCAVTTVAHPSAANPPGDASCFDQENLGNHREPNQRSSTGTVATLPRASLLIGPLRGISLSISAGTGARSVDPIYVSQDIKTPFASIQAYEVGAALTRTTDRFSLVARSAVFRTHVDKDLIFSETAGRNVLGVGTTRTGGMAALRLTGSTFDQAANITLVRATFDDTHLLVPYVPDIVVRSDTAFHHDLPLALRGMPVQGRLGIGLTYVGPRALPYGDRSDAIFTVDGQASLVWRNLTMSLAATNLLDRRYKLGEFNYPSDFRLDPQSSPTLVPVRHFTAGSPRGVFATLALTFGGV